MYKVPDSGYVQEQIKPKLLVRFLDRSMASVLSFKCHSYVKHHKQKHSDQKWSKMSQPTSGGLRALVESCKRQAAYVGKEQAKKC